MSIMTRGMATEWGGSGVRVNAIAPGFTLTDLTRKLWSDPTMKEWGLNNTPLGRMGEVDDMVGAAIFLASDASAFVTGQILYVDGVRLERVAWLELLRSRGKRICVVSTQNWIASELRMAVGSHYIDLQDLRSQIERTERPRELENELHDGPIPGEV